MSFDDGKDIMLRPVSGVQCFPTLIPTTSSSFVPGQAVSEKTQESALENKIKSESLKQETNPEKEDTDSKSEESEKDTKEAN